MAKQNYATRPMNRLVSSRAGKFAALAALATFSLTACGSDPTSASEPAGAEPGSSANASGLACPAGKISAEGSSARANAITEVIADYNAQCGDKATIEATADRIWRGYQVVLQRPGRLRQKLRLRTQDRGEGRRYRG